MKGLTQTTPTVVLKMHEIIRRSEDCRSRNDAVMNDGIGRISFGLMNRVREALGL